MSDKEMKFTFGNDAVTIMIDNEGGDVTIVTAMLQSIHLTERDGHASVWVNGTGMGQIDADQAQWLKELMRERVEKIPDYVYGADGVKDYTTAPQESWLRNPSMMYGEFAGGRMTATEAAASMSEIIDDLLKAYVMIEWATRRVVTSGNE